MDAKNWIKRQWEFIKTRYYTWWNSYHFKQKKKEADRLHKLTGRRYFVVPSGDRLEVVDNSYLKFYNAWAKHKGQKQIRLPDLLKMAYYHTSQEPLTRKKTSS